jgi:hypothetical protein
VGEIMSVQMSLYFIFKTIEGISVKFNPGSLYQKFLGKFNLC